MQPDARLQKKAGHLLEPGEIPLIALSLGNGRGAKELPVDSIEAVLTDRRIVFMDWPMLKPKSVWRAVDLFDVTDISVDKLGARLNRTGEFVLRFHVGAGETITGVHLAAGGGRKAVEDFIATFRKLAAPPPPPPPPA